MQGNAANFFWFAKGSSTTNKVFTTLIPQYFGKEFTAAIPGHPLTVQVGPLTAIWAVEGALLVGILSVIVFAFKPVIAKFAEGTKAAVAGSLLASMNTASEYGFGGVIAALPGFVVVAAAGVDAPPADGAAEPRPLSTIISGLSM